MARHELKEQPCAKCGWISHTAISAMSRGVVLSGLGKIAQNARFCTQCRKWFCGKCAFPNWEKKKKERGIEDGPLLYEKLSEEWWKQYGANPGDAPPIFSETPTCPECGSTLQAENPADKKCFIATAAIGSADAWQVIVLRNFRDKTLLESVWGVKFVSVYNRCSPPLARWLGAKGWARRLVVVMIVSPVARLVRAWVTRKS